jgi:RNA recognition motif-containing protein
MATDRDATGAIQPIGSSAFTVTTTPLSKIHQIADAETQLANLNEPRTKAERSTKVFIGKIPPALSDYLIEKILLELGAVLSWKRALDSSGNPKGFGFAEFVEVEGMLRCIRLLNGYKVLEEKLLVRIDE